MTISKGVSCIVALCLWLTLPLQANLPETVV